MTETEAEPPPPPSLREVVVLKPPSSFRIYETQYCAKFKFHKAWEHDLPIPLFLSTHASHVTALLCTAETPITAEILHLLPSLRLIVATSVGVDHLDLAECRRRRIHIANAANLFAADVADTAVGLLIDVLRRISSGHRYVTRGLWALRGEYSLGFKLGGKQVGIVGYGRIGFEVAKRLEAFGCSIMYNSRNQKSSVPYRYFSDVCELAANCDILIICCSLTEKTHGMISKQVMSALGKEGVLINVARGAIIDEKEMVRRLMNGELRGAGLDVFENEPNVPEELFALDNVVLSAHRAVFTEESFFGSYQLASGNLEAFFSNKPLLSPVVMD